MGEGTSPVARQSLVEFIIDAVNGGMQPKELTLNDFLIEAQESERIFEALVQSGVECIEKLDLGQNQHKHWWTDTNCQLLCQLIGMQKDLKNLTLMTEKVPFLMARQVIKATSQLENFTIEHEKYNGRIKCEEEGALLVNKQRLLGSSEEIELAYDSIEQKYEKEIGFEKFYGGPSMMPDM